MLCPAQWSTVIENLDEPVRWIRSFPDFVGPEPSSVNRSTTRDGSPESCSPPSTAPKP
jgi:hypothetical protein